MWITKAGKFLRHRICAVLLTSLLSSADAQSFAEDNAPKGWDLVYDFMVQDVCIDASGKVLLGVSPVDGPGKCPQHRNLRVGERLPFHKHDWADFPARGRLPFGYQREDSFPIRTRLLGTAVAQIFDFGGGARSFGQFDHGDGGQIVVFSAWSVAFGLTEDGSGGLQFFFGPECNAAQPGLRIVDSWIVVDHSFVPNQSGQVLARLNRNLNACPDRLDYAFTRWHSKSVNFQTKSGEKVEHRTFVALISEHFGGRDVVTAGHLERFYFTQELGLTRWERWQNLARRERTNDRTRSANLAANGRCEHIEAQPAATGEWVMVDCRQWTNITPAASSEGDSPTFWIDRLRNTPTARGLFAK